MIILNSIEEIHNFIIESKFALLYFSLENCGVCVDVLPKLEGIIESIPKVKLCKIEIDKIPSAAGEFSVFTFPCIILYINGKETIREARFISMDELSEKIKRYYSILKND